MADRSLFRPSFRIRVLGSFAALLSVALFAGLLLQRAFLLEDLEREVRADLDQEREELQSLAGGNDPDTGDPFEGDVEAIFDTFLVRNVPHEGEVYIALVDGSLYKATRAPDRLASLSEFVERWGELAAGEGGALATEAGPVRYLAVPLLVEGEPRGVFVVANFLAGEQAEIENFIQVAAVTGVVILLLLTAVAWLVAGRLLRPVRDLTALTEMISESDLSQRIPLEGDDEIARLATRFNEMLDRLETAFTTQRHFVDDAGHELRTPITIIRGHLDVMSDDPIDRARTMAVVSDELDRMARIVDDLLLLATAEQPDFLSRRPVELADLTFELLAKARALGDRRWQLDGSGEGGLLADPQRVTQAGLNLAHNAVAHTDTDAVIGLGSARDRGEVRLWVRDTGVGVDQSERERIFDRFARGRHGRRSGGAGLGLAIVASIADAHGGRVELDSTVGQGATFTIVLPGMPLTVDRTARTTIAAREVP